MIPKRTDGIQTIVFAAVLFAISCGVLWLRNRGLLP